MAHPKIMIIGSDNSGDLYGSKVANLLTRLHPDIILFGMGGPNMRDAGVRLLYDISDLDNMGVIESIKGAHLIKRLVQRISESMERIRPDLVVQIGSPVFNMRLVELAKAKDIKVVYYNSPLSGNPSSVNAARFAKVVDKVLAVTHHELEACTQAGIDVEFVGHPLMDLIGSSLDKGKTIEELGLSAQSPIVVVLPGGRGVEVKTILPVILRSLKKVRKRRGEIQIIVSLPSVVSQDLVNEIVGNCGLDDVKVTTSRNDVLAIADAAIVTCGCTSLEAALMRIPSLAVHKVATTSYLLDKMLARKTMFAMVNIILQQAVVHEFVQSELTDSRVAKEVERLLSSEEQNQEMLDSFDQLPEHLGNAGSIKRAAEAILAMLEDK